MESSTVNAPGRYASEAAAAGVTDAEALSWRDGKRYAWLLGLLVPMIPFGALQWNMITGSDIAWWFGPIVIFVLFPTIDILAGIDGSNPPASLIEWLENDKYYRWCTFLFLPIQFASLAWVCWMWTRPYMDTVDKVGLAATVGMVSGIAIACAHELGHKKEKLERWLSKVALAPSMYGHFFIEHNRGHHVRVSTPEDPASARMGESFYAFWPRTVWGSLRSAWRLESARFARLKRSKWSLGNDILNAWLMTVVLFATLTAIFGWETLPLLLLQGVIGFSMLEVVNYLEHYGLLRQKGEDGRYERCQPEHSWNSNNTWSNVMLYHLQRHSDHHAHPTRRYQALRHMDDAPQLPTGYAGMIVLAVFPPAWYKVMDKRLVEHYGGDVERCNIQPRARKRLLKRWSKGGDAAAPATEGSA